MTRNELAIKIALHVAALVRSHESTQQDRPGLQLLILGTFVLQYRSNTGLPLAYDRKYKYNNTVNVFYGGNLVLRVQWNVDDFDIEKFEIGFWTDEIFSSNFFQISDIGQ